MARPNQHQEAIELACEIIELAEDDQASLHTLLRKMRRIALLTGRREIQLWTDWQQQGCELVHGPKYAASQQGTQWAEMHFWRTRRLHELDPDRQPAESWGDQPQMAHSVFELEELLEKHQESHKKFPYAQYAEWIQIPRILARIRDEIHTIASEVVVWLRFGDVVQGIFEQACSLVDAQLISLAPEAAKELQAAYAQLGSAAEPEELAAAANACRRVLKDLADAIRPVGQGNDYRHDCGPDKYVNRLCAYAREQIESETTTAALVADIDHLAARIDTVNKLAHKGTHADFTLSEARMSLIHTYLIVADLLQLARVDDPAEDQGE